MAVVSFFYRIPETSRGEGGSQGFMLNMSELSPLILTIAVLLGGVVSGFSGFAFSPVSGAILLHFLEPLVPIPWMMCCRIASQIRPLPVILQLVRSPDTPPSLLSHPP